MNNPIPTGPCDGCPSTCTDCELERDEQAAGLPVELEPARTLPEWFVDQDCDGHS